MTSALQTEGPLKLRKPVEALVMVPKTNKLSPLSRKMYNVMLYVSQAQLRVMQGIPPATHLFEAPLNEVLKVCGADDQRNRAKKCLAEMRKCEVEWSSTDDKFEFTDIAFSLVSESRISLRRGAVWVHWALAPALYEALTDPERWATIDLRMLARLDTYAAIVLYEICTKYRDNPSNLTCRKDVEWWIQVLMCTPVATAENGTLKLPEWRKFKHQLVNSAIEQINQVTDLNVELLEDKEGGKAIKTAQFRVTIKRPGVLLEDDDLGEINQGLLQHANRVGGLTEQDIASMTRAHGDKAVADALRQLEARQKQLALPLVKSKKGYMRHLLGEQKAEQPAPASEVANEVFDELPPFSAKVELQKSPQVAAPINSDIVRARTESVANEILSLDPAEQKRWLDAYEHKMRSGNLFTPSIERRVRDSNWFVGLVRAGMIDLYGESKYGTGWKDRPETE